jgi:hypothetical protein
MHLNEVPSSRRAAKPAPAKACSETRRTGATKEGVPHHTSFANVAKEEVRREKKAHLPLQ